MTEKTDHHRRDDRDSSYRREIDGLRGFAVIAVVVNHFSKYSLPSGYLGVDIFFVISGYVITSSLVSRPQTTLGDFLVLFYRRRIQRLVPALTLCVAVSGILICLFDPEPISSLRTGIAALLGLSNIYMLKQATDYFGSNTELNVFTHTWSLGVEEQFYLFFPALVWLAALRSRTTMASRHLLYAISILSTISVGSFIYLYQTNQPAAYFLMPTRLWELGTGCVCCLGLRASTPVFENLKQVSPSLVSAALAAALFLDPHYAIFATIAVVSLTALLISSVRAGTSVYKLLTLRGVIYLGLISYSLYLWHWTVLALSRWTIGVHWWSSPIQVAVMLLVAAGSYQYVEKPLRRYAWSASAWKTIGYGASASLCVAMLLIALLSRGTLLYSGSPSRFKDVSISSSKAAYTGSGDSRGNVILIGDSHATHFGDLANAVAAELHVRSSLISKGATPFPTVNISTPVGGLTATKNQLNNSEMVNAVRTVLRAPGSDSLILLSSFYRFYFDTPSGSRKYQKLTHYLKNGQYASSRQALDIWLADLATFSHTYQQARIVVFLSTPEMPDIYPEALCGREWFRPAPSDKCYVNVPRRDVLSQIAWLNNAIVAGVATLPNVWTFDPVPSLCPEKNEFCSSHDGKARLYSDEDHLTRYGSRRVAESFVRFIREKQIVIRPSPMKQAQRVSELSLR